MLSEDAHSSSFVFRTQPQTESLNYNMGTVSIGLYSSTSSQPTSAIVSSSKCVNHYKSSVGRNESPSEASTVPSKMFDPINNDSLGKEAKTLE